ncbi:putative 2OG-Fe(II) oxygenase [Rheinheimera baltica]|uniref:putative 2OG-Fe(II) oxygenase n=1 Tax=Rheinheimera baltica TaxID=67576 RepID=UPI0003F78E41|nr:putative 2OG-Fe(II) oxygenase [Rheinheimera baltica]
MISLDLIKRFQQISYYFNQHAFIQVVALFSPVLAVDNVPAEIALMYAVSLRRLGQHEKSKICFSTALKAHPTNAALRNSFGNLLLEMEQPQLALAEFAHVTKLEPTNSDGYLNSARALSRLALYDKALEHSKTAHNLQPNNMNIAIALAENLVNTAQLDKAEALYDKLLQREPHNIKLLNNLGNLKRQLGSAADAIHLLERAATSNNSTVLRNLAACYVLDNQFERAYNCYQAAIAAAPDDVLAYAEYAALLWQQGDAKPFLHIEQRLNAAPEHHALRVDYIKTLLNIDQPDTAERYLEPLLQHFPSDSAVLTLATTVYRNKGDLEKAEYFGRSALAQVNNTSNIAARSELAFTLLAQYKGEEALAHYQHLCDDDPLNQGWWTTLSSALKLTSAKQQYNWLCDYTLVSADVISSRESSALLPVDFNQRLLPLLNKLHCNARPPLGLSLQKGSQTFENIFDRQDAVLQQLQQAVIQQACKFISQLLPDPKHPFLSRLSTDLKFQGSWSVQLRDEGFHKSHFHPMGWLSGVYYVDVPDAVEHDGQGWLVFGRPDIPNVLDVGDFAVKPQPGMLVLFPSFMWHGTNPFKSATNRVTVAFDIVPESTGHSRSF